MKRMLIVYATREGQTAKVAERIVRHLTDAGVTVTVGDAADTKKLDSINLDAFELLVFGASMHVGGLEKELAHYVNVNRERIATKKRSFFLVLLSAATQDPTLRETSLADARRRFNAQLDVDFDDVEMIAGALMYTKYSWPIKWVMKRIAKKAGGSTDTSKDHEYTDWAQVRRYAERLGQSLES